MKTTTDFLPDPKQQELRLIVDLIREKYPKGIEMIILFGSFARGDFVEELCEDGFNYKYQSDFDIFVVTGYEHLANKIERDDTLWNLLDRRIKTPVSIISHDIDYFNRRLRKGQYFFLDIKKEGVLLFDTGKHELAEEKELTAEERRKFAEDDFKYYFEKAGKLQSGFQFYFDKDDYNEAAFLLHQTTERLYTAVLLVLTRYKPNTHDLKKLSKRVASQAPVFLKIFPQGTDQEKRLFELLRKAYVDARYSKNYKITSEELTWLAERVELLREMTKEVCQKKIESFA